MPGHVEHVEPEKILTQRQRTHVVARHVARRHEQPVHMHLLLRHGATTGQQPHLQARHGLHVALHVLVVLQQLPGLLVETVMDTQAAHGRLQPGFQLQVVHGFVQNVIRTGIQAIEQLLLGQPRPNQDDVNVPGQLQGPDLPAQGHPAQAWQVPIGHHQGHPILFDRAPQESPVRDGAHLVPPALQPLAVVQARRVVGIGQQHRKCQPRHVRSGRSGHHPGF